MAGRIKYEQINSMIEELNTVTGCKYKIMDTPVNKLNSDNMRRYTVSFRKQSLNLGIPGAPACGGQYFALYFEVSWSEPHFVD